MAALVATGDMSPVESGAPIAAMPVDPIFAAIEAHNVAYAEYVQAMNERAAAPEAPAASLRWSAAGKAWHEAAWQLADTAPTTAKGVAALIEYAYALRAEHWPEILCRDGVVWREVLWSSLATGAHAVGGRPMVVPHAPCRSPDDAIFDLIERHRCAMEALAALNEDDPRGRGCQDAVTNALRAIIECVPATPAGISAALRYVASDVDTGLTLDRDQLAAFLFNLDDALRFIIDPVLRRRAEAANA